MTATTIEFRNQYRTDADVAAAVAATNEETRRICAAHNIPIDHPLPADAMRRGTSLSNILRDSNYASFELLAIACRESRSIETQPERIAREKAEKAAAEAAAKLEAIDAATKARHADWNNAIRELELSRKRAAHGAEVVANHRSAIEEGHNLLPQYIGVEFDEKTWFQIATNIVMTQGRLPVLERAAKTVEAAYKEQVAIVRKMAVDYDVPRDCYPPELSEKK